jgi:hypothetical protein
MWYPAHSCSIESFVLIVESNIYALNLERDTHHSSNDINIWKCWTRNSIHWSYYKFTPFWIFIQLLRIHPIPQFWTLRNWFRPIPSNSALNQFPKFRTGIGPRPHPHASYCVRRLIRSMWMQSRYGILWIESKRNWTEFRPIPSDSGIRGIGSSSVQFRESVPVLFDSGIA